MSDNKVLIGDMDRKICIEVLKRLLEAMEVFDGISPSPERINAIKMAIASLEIDEAYQLEYERTTKNDLGVDAVSRADVLKLMQDNWHTHNGDYAMQESMDDIRALPSVTPIRPKGHWIADVDRWGDVVTTVNGYKCDKCNAFNSDKDNYCPNCGADMREVVEE